MQCSIQRMRLTTQPLPALQHAVQYSVPHAAHHPAPAASPYAYLLVVPCDSPLFPLDLLQRLADGLTHAQADIAVVAIDETDLTEATPADAPSRTTNLRAQPVFCLLRTSLLHSLRTYMAAGGKKIDTWIRQQALVEVPFNTYADNPHHFFNANTLEQLEHLHQC